MKIREIMTAKPKTASPRTSLAAAAHLLWDADCGILPVVEEGKLVGVVTDRDMYIALATRNKPASQITVGDVTSGAVSACGPDDEVQVAFFSTAPFASGRDGGGAPLWEGTDSWPIATAT